jgi:CHAD domain-containing protein
VRGLNAARDWDVFLAETLPKTRKLLDRQSLLDSDLQTALAAAAQQARQQAQAQLLAPTFSRLILAIGRDLLTIPAAPKMPEARQWAAKILEKRWLALRKRCRNFAKLNPEERHMARIAAKKMRYAADAFIPLYGKRGARFIDALAALQNSLGSANDAHVGALMMHALIDKARNTKKRKPEAQKPDAALAFDLGRIAGALETEVGRRANLSGTIWRRLAQSRLFWRA